MVMLRTKIEKLNESLKKDGNQEQEQLQQEQHKEKKKEIIKDER